MFVSQPAPSQPPHLYVTLYPGYHNIELELQTPTELSYEPPTPLRHHDFFKQDSLDSPTTTPARPSDLTLNQTTSDPPAQGPCAQPPTVVEEDTSLDNRRDLGSWGPEASTGEDTGVSRESVVCDEPRDSEEASRAPEQAAQAEPSPQGQGEEIEKEIKDQGLPVGGPSLSSGPAPDTSDWKENAEEAGQSGSMLVVVEEEEEEMTQERLLSLLEEIKLEEGSEEEEMTEERLNAILAQVQQAEKDMCSIPGWRSDASSNNMETPTPGRTPGAEGPERR